MCKRTHFLQSLIVSPSWPVAEFLYNHQWCYECSCSVQKKFEAWTLSQYLWFVTIWTAIIISFDDWFISNFDIHIINFDTYLFKIPLENEICPFQVKASCIFRTISVSLGVDRNVNISYLKPTVNIAQSKCTSCKLWDRPTSKQ